MRPTFCKLSLLMYIKLIKMILRINLLKSVVFQIRSKEKIDAFSNHQGLIRAALKLCLELVIGRTVFYVKDKYSKFKTETLSSAGDQYIYQKEVLD